MSSYQQQAKQTTLRQILNHIKFKDTFTAREIASKLKKTLPTINSSIKYLVEQEYVSAIGEESGQLGRPAMVWRSNILDLKSVAIEIQLNKIVIAQITLGGKILIQEEYDILGADILTVFNQKTALFLEKHSLKNCTKKIGVSVPGPVDFSRKKMLFSANLSVRNLDFTISEELLGIEIIVENNANSAVLGEFFLDQDIKDKIYISITKSGVGGGQILEQKLQRGTTRKGGEIGHMTIDLYGIPCTCGRRGCLERYVSEQGMLSIAQKYGIKNVSIDEICSNLSLEYKRVIREYSLYLGKGIQNLIFILDPSTIIVGGFVSRYWEIFEPLLIEEVFFNNTITDNSHKPILKAAIFKNQTSLYGAGLLTFLELFYDKSVFW